MDALDLLTHLGSAEEKADGKYSLTINGKHLVFHKPHDKQLDAHAKSPSSAITLALAGISPENPYGTPRRPNRLRSTLWRLIDHHGAKLYQSISRQISLPKPSSPTTRIISCITCITATKCANVGNAPEDLTFYDRIAEALRDADRSCCFTMAQASSNASRVFAERLKKVHPGVYARIVRQADVNTSAMTEAEIIAYARQVLTPGAPA